jgi:hypothetical protein
MAGRLKIYYPEDQIIRNLFTKGNEYMYMQDFKEYVGFYHRYTTGEIFTEYDWDSLRSRRLIRFRPLSESHASYYQIKHFVVDNNGQRVKVRNGLGDQYYKYRAPRHVKRKLTDAELNNGSINRYFVYKRNEPNRVFYEIDESQTINYGTNNSGINQYLYDLLIIPWKVNGPEYDILINGILSKPGVVNTNLRILEKYGSKFPLIRKLVRSPRELTIYE